MLLAGTYRVLEHEMVIFVQLPKNWGCINLIKPQGSDFKILLYTGY